MLSSPAFGPPAMFLVGVFGASGTSGAELIRLIAGHPSLSLGFATSRSYAGRSLRYVEPSAPSVRLIDPAEADPASVDLVFTCLPHGSSAPVVKRAIRAGARVVDLSGDFRLRSPTLHAEVYGSPRSASLAAHAVYGLTELHRAAVSQAKLVANPGCYPTCISLGLAPLVARAWVRGPIVIDAKSGVSGAGRSPSSTTHFVAVTDDVRPYQLGRSHRHTPEIEQTLTWVRGLSSVQVIFNPHVVPIERGMLATMVVHLPGRSRVEVHDAFVAAYAREPFVEVLAEGAARIRAVCRTNRVQIGVSDVQGTEHMVVTCSIDNLGKGAAGQALQNANLMLGLPETLGLLSPTSLVEVSA